MELLNVKFVVLNTFVLKSLAIVVVSLSSESELDICDSNWQWSTDDYERIDSKGRGKGFWPIGNITTRKLYLLQLSLVQD